MREKHKEHPQDLQIPASQKGKKTHQKTPTYGKNPTKDVKKEWRR
jgi:hypothetical protein